jgi:hypothetical protein
MVIKCRVWKIFAAQTMLIIVLKILCPFIKGMEKFTKSLNAAAAALIGIIPDDVQKAGAVALGPASTAAIDFSMRQSKLLSKAARAASHYYREDWALDMQRHH